MASVGPLLLSSIILSSMSIFFFEVLTYKMQHSQFPYSLSSCSSRYLFNFLSLNILFTSIKLLISINIILLIGRLTPIPIAFSNRCFHDPIEHCFCMLYYILHLIYLMFYLSLKSFFPLFFFITSDIKNTFLTFNIPLLLLLIPPFQIFTSGFYYE